LPKASGVSEVDTLWQEVWRIDKDETASSLALMRYNVLQLFVSTNGDHCRRRLIVDLEAPKFESGALISQDPASLYVKSAADLNNDQKRAIHKVRLFPKLLDFYFFPHESHSLHLHTFIQHISFTFSFCSNIF
jgi:DNA replication ATP-dependent helicase Dna2